MRILLVEDKLELCELLQRAFENNKVDVDYTVSGEDGLSWAMMNEYDVIVLDIMLPGMSGISLLHHLRRRNKKTPVLMLSAKDGLNDKVEALESGADDYLIKPFAFQELLARVRALSRRSQPIQGDTLCLGNVTLDRNSLAVTMNGVEIKTSQKEALLLECLIQNKDNYVSKDAIIGLLSGGAKGLQSNNAEVYIHYLRKKFPPELSGLVIKTKHRYGYRIQEVQRV